MSLRDLVEGECGGANSLVRLTSHFVQDRGMKEEGLGHAFPRPPDDFSNSDADELVEQFLGETLGHSRQTFRMDSLLEEMREIEMTAPIQAPGVAALATTDPATLREVDSIWANQYLESGKQFDEILEGDQIWTTADNMDPCGEKFEFGFGPNWAQEYLQSSEQIQNFNTGTADWQDKAAEKLISDGALRETANQLVNTMDDPKFTYSKVLAALRFYAIGGYQDSIGNDLNVSLSQKSVSRAIEEVTAAINRIMPTYIRFPIIPEEQAAVTRGFHNRYQFPGVLGIIDCTHVSIIAPPTEDPNYPEVNYLNRKGYHSLNVQLVCDVNMRIMHTNALYPGSTSDKFIWQFCNLRPALVAKYEADNRMDCFLLGDGGYNLEPWMMIPDTTAQPNSPEAYFNDRQMVVRCTIERCNGLLKARFRCLLKHRVLHYHPEMASCMVNACAVLHNKCIDAGVDYEQDTDEDNYEESSESEEEIEDPEEIRRNRRRNPILVAGEKIRARLIRKHFT